MNLNIILSIVIFTFGWLVLYLFFVKKIIKLKKNISAEVNNRIAIQSQLDQLTKLDEKYQSLLKETYKNIMHEQLSDAKDNFEESNYSDMKKLIDPFQQKIEKFEKNISDHREHMVEDLSKLQEQFKRLETVGTRSDELVNALTSSHKMQGNLGELTLEYVLDNCGLDKNIHYETQYGVKVEGKNRILDCVIKMPLGGKIIIDSKYSFNPFIEYMNAQNDETKEIYLQKLLEASKDRIDELSKKEYHKSKDIKSEDYVFLFTPNDLIFKILVTEDARTSSTHKNIYQYASEKNVIIVGPSTLLATLKTLSKMYREIDVSENAKEVAEEAGKMYDKILNIVKSMDETKSNLEKALNSHDQATRQLSQGPGNLLSRAEKFLNQKYSIK